MSQYWINSKPKSYILQACSTNSLNRYAGEGSVCQSSKIKNGSRLGFSSSLWHSQADEAGQTGHAEADASDDRHADQAVWKTTGESAFCPFLYSNNSDSQGASLPFFKALLMRCSRSRACLFPGSFFRRVRMYFRALSYSWKKRHTTSF